MTMRLEEVQFIAILVEAILYGLYLATFIRCMQVLLWLPGTGWKPFSNINKTIISVTLVLFVLGTFNFSLGIVRCIQGLFAHKIPRGPVVQVGQDWINIMKPFWFRTRTSIADLVLVYRCWVICGRSRLVVAIPAILWIAGVAFNVVTLVFQATLRAGHRLSAKDTHYALPLFWASVIALNIYATSAIVHRIWKIDHERITSSQESAVTFSRDRRPQTRLSYILWVIVDSALLYTISTIALFASIFTSKAIYITSAIESQVVGITFNLILVRVSRELAGSAGYPSRDDSNSVLHFRTVTTTGGTIWNLNRDESEKMEKGLTDDSISRQRSYEGLEARGSAV